MAFIGNNNANDNYTTTANRAYVSNTTQFTYVAGASEEVFRFAIFNAASTSGQTATISLRDASSGVATATVVDSAVILGTSSLNQWSVFTLLDPAQLVNGRLYTVSVWFDGAWSGRTENSAFVSNKTLRLSGQTSDPIDFSAGSDESRHMAFYAETRPSSIVPTTQIEKVTINFDETVNNVVKSAVLRSSDYTTGIVITQNKGAGGEEIAITMLSTVLGDTEFPAYDAEFTTLAGGGDTITVDYDGSGDMVSVATGLAVAPFSNTITIC